MLKLIGDSEKLQLNLPECDGKGCPEISVERLNSNQSFIDEFIDTEILKQLGQISCLYHLWRINLQQRVLQVKSACTSEAKSALAKC